MTSHDTDADALKAERDPKPPTVWLCVRGHEWREQRDRRPERCPTCRTANIGRQGQFALPKRFGCECGADELCSMPRTGERTEAEWQAWIAKHPARMGIRSLRREAARRKGWGP